MNRSFHQSLNQASQEAVIATAPASSNELWQAFETARTAVILDLHLNQNYSAKEIADTVGASLPVVGKILLEYSKKPLDKGLYSVVQ